MFIRKKKNKSGSISVQVIDKSTGKYRVLKTIGSSKDSKIIESLVIKGKEWIKSYSGQLDIDFSQKLNNDLIFDSIKEIRSSGLSLLLDVIYNDIGFSRVENKLFK